MSEERPVCRLQLREKNIPLFEDDIIIDADEVEKEISFKFDIQLNASLEVEIEPCIIYNEKEIKTIYRSPIFVGTGSIGYDKHREEI